MSHSTSRADAYGPERIALRDQESLAICDNCLSTYYTSEQHACPAGIEYLDTYNAAPDWDGWPVPGACAWNEITAAGLQLLSDDLYDADRDSSAGIEENTAAQNLRADRAGVTAALKLAEQGQIVYVAQDEDGYYFATATGGDGSTITLDQLGDDRCPECDSPHGSHAPSCQAGYEDSFACQNEIDRRLGK